MTVPKIIDKLNAATEEFKKPVTFLPNQLTAAACIDVLDRMHIPTAIAASTGEALDIADVDAGLAKTSLSISDKIRLKQALTSFGLLPRGKKVA
jgi:hypothetical protein